MKASDFFAKVELLPFTSIDALVTGGGLVVVAPHPDDESLGCGGIIAAARERGIEVHLVVVSDGTGSHPNSRRYPPEALRDLRELETIEAASYLGLSKDAVSFLRLPDRHVPTVGEGAERAKEVIEASMESVAAKVCLVTWSEDPHCDHQASADLVKQLRDARKEMKIFAYPVWGWTLDSETDVGGTPVGWRVDITKHLATKMKAIAAHKSQITNLIDDDATGFRLSSSMLAHCLKPAEFLLEA